MKTYLITDTHFSHQNIKKYCDRPEGFEELIFENLEMLMSEAERHQDKNFRQIIHLGDIAMGKEPEKWLERFKITTEGMKTTLVVGNHDKKTKTYYKQFFDEVVDSLIVQSYYDNGNVYMSHHGVDVIPKPAIYQVYGHHHNSPLPAREKAWENSFQLSLEREYYKPVELEEVIWRVSNGIKY